MRSAPVFLALLATVASDLVVKRPTKEEYLADKKAAAEEAKEKAAREAKLAAVNKVITMLEDLTSQVLAEGEREAASYNKFACFCKDTTAEKSEAITKGEDDKESLTSTINALGEKRDTLDEEIGVLEDDIEDEEAALKKATDERHETLKVYEKNAADLEGALAALDGAIDALKSSKSPSLVQVQGVAKTVQTATLLADALGLPGAADAQHKFAAFLQQPEVEMEDYKSHSGGVIETLEGLKKDFRKTKVELDADEVKSVAEYDALKQEKVDFIKAKNAELDANKEEKDKTTSEIQLRTEELTTVAADLLDNQQYLSELAEMCEATAKTWDQRTRVRSDELSALTAATAIIKEGVTEHTSTATVRFAQQGVRLKMAKKIALNQEDMEAFEAEAEAAEAAPSFFQRNARTVLSSIARHSQSVPSEKSREVVMTLLMTEGTKLKSTLLTSLANQIRADPFAKIKRLIQEMIEKLLQEATDEANQKGFCDKAQADAKQKRDLSTERIDELNAEMAELEATRDKLNEELELLAKEIAELEIKMEEATKHRKEENAENEATLLEANAGLDAVNQAIDILDKFYKTAAKEKVDLGLVQQGPNIDAPGAGFEAGEEYTGAGGESGGILGMLDVIKSDFERTISTTEKAEAQAESEYQKFMTESTVSLEEKKIAEEMKTKQRDSAIEELESADENLASHTEILKVAIKELIELKPQCVDTGMSYEERVAQREDEIEGLKKALCVLENQEDPAAAAETC